MVGIISFLSKFQIYSFASFPSAGVEIYIERLRKDRKKEFAFHKINFLLKFRRMKIF